VARHAEDEGECRFAHQPSDGGAGQDVGVTNISSWSGRTAAREVTVRPSQRAGTFIVNLSEQTGARLGDGGAKAYVVAQVQHTSPQ
jgi:hypothetical protein